MTLTDQERERIKAEEEFRQQIRAALAEQSASQPTRLSRAITFLNSSLGLWLLTSVFVGVFSWAYTEFTNYTKAQRAVEQHHHQMAKELDYRTYALSYMFSGDTLTFNYTAEHLKCLLSAAINGADCTVDNVVQRAYLYKEYKDTNVDALFYQLEDVEQENPGLPRKQADAHQAYTAAFYRLQNQIYKADASVKAEASATQRP